MQTRRCFDAHADHGHGAWGWTATTEAGITRWATSEAKAIEVARRQERIYRDAGLLDDVLERTAGLPCCDTTHADQRETVEVAA